MGKKRTKIVELPAKKINMRMSKKLAGVLGAIVAVLLLLIGNIIYISLAKGDEYKRIVLTNNQQQYINKTIAFKRGDITDRNGSVLATSKRVYNVVLDCMVVNTEKTDEDKNVTTPYVEPTVKALARYLSIDENLIREKLTSSETKKSQYQIIKKNVTQKEKEEFQTAISATTEGISKEDQKERANIKGVWFEETYLRVYPQNSIACDAIGFLNDEGQGGWGIEGYYNEELNGIDGRSFGYFNGDSDVEQTIINPTQGSNVVSTLDLNIQQIIRGALEQFDEKYKNGPNGEDSAKNVAVLVMDPNTGEILGMDSSKPYDLNNPRDLSSYLSQDKIEAMTDSDKSNLLNEMWKNYCVSDAFEPGSVFKPFTVAAGLATKTISKEDKYICDGFEIINNQIIKCAVFPDMHGELDTAGALINSCNDAMMQMSGKIGADNLTKYFDIFNFGKKTEVDLPSENPGIIYNTNSMGTVELATSSFGQGFTCNMVQEAAAMCSVINGGNYYRPHIVKQITDNMGNIIENKEKILEKVTVSKDVSDFLKDTMERVVNEGTGESAKIDGYRIGGKTGTAEKLPRGENKYLDSFVGFAPVDNPKVLIYVIVDEPNVEQQASSVFAQEISREIFTQIMPYMNIYMETTPQEQG